jgi:hypothetical protein
MFRFLSHSPLFALLVLLATSCESGKPKFTLSVHSEGSDMDSPRSIMPDLVGNPPRKVILKRSPEFTQKNISAYQTFPSDSGNGSGVALRLDFKGAQALELVTRMRNGEILRTLLNGRPVDYVTIDRPITDGIFIIWEGVPDEVVAEMAKLYPTISGLQSASPNLDMTPSTKAEKKRSLRLFKKTQREAGDEAAAATEAAMPSSRDAAAIQVPAGFEAPIDPRAPLPEGAP